MAALGARRRMKRSAVSSRICATLGANTVIIHAYAALPSAAAPLGDVFFPTRSGRSQADLLSRVTWQIRTRAGVDVYPHLPLAASAAAVGRPMSPPSSPTCAVYPP